MVESKEELKSLLVRVKEEYKKASLKIDMNEIFYEKKKKRSWHLAPHSIANRKEKSGSSDKFPFLGL